MGLFLLPEEQTGYVEGDVVRFSGGSEMLAPEEGEDGGSGKLVKVALSSCEKVADTKMAESLHYIILRPKT